MPKKIETNAVENTASSNASGLLASLGLTINNDYKSREEIAQEIVAKGNGLIVKHESIRVITETVEYTDDFGEDQSFDALRVEMPAGSLKLIKNEDDSYAIVQSSKPFVANASYGSKMHKDSKQVLIELVAPGETSAMSEKTNDEEYIILIYHLL